MAEERDDTERSEDPTAKRLDDAIKRGDVVRSTEVNTWFTIAGGVLVLMVFATPMAQTLEMTFRGILADSYQIPADGPAIANLTKKIAIDVLAALNSSYDLFEPGEVPAVGDVAALVTKTAAGAFRIGIQLSAPFLAFGLLFNIGLGVLSRLMP
ncbi:MAG TPA: EscU/YscU/HrcU family type III secretion system export apparatus switch protein, partial [Xanthobacteraceae bacterium]|nr:EscU/YscU/HrcU family type III secretion system export apparatus switch protein [Xanthobacteraceae bacterium]